MRKLSDILENGSTGSYTLSAGTLTTILSEEIGASAGGVSNGTFVQTGGTNTTGTLAIGNGGGTGFGTYALSAGTLNAAVLNFNGAPSRFSWTGGTLNLTSDVTWDSAAGSSTTSAVFGPSLVLNNTQTLGVTGNEVLGGVGPFGLTRNGGSAHNATGSVTISPQGTLTLNGGTLSLGTLVNNGTFNFIASTLTINQAGASINTPIVTGNPSTINVNANNVSLGSAASFSGFSHQGILNVGANTVTLNSAGYARLGVFTSLSGGTINAPNGVTLASGSNFQGSGTVSARLSGESGAVIEASGVLSLGDATSQAGFNYAGELRTKQFTVTLNSAGQASLGNLTTMSDGVNPGALEAANGFVLNFGNAITGYGTIDSPNLPTQVSVVNGSVQGMSAGQPITLSGWIKGTGTFNNVTFTGTHDPGFSPTLLHVGNVNYASTASLDLELGGTVRGTQYDAIDSSGNLALGGSLVLSLIDKFAPAAGNSFHLLNWISHTGVFSTVQLPELAGGLVWNATQLYTTGTLSVGGLQGDYNQNGAVDAADYTLWRDTLGSTTNLAADGNGNGVIDAGDYDVWKMHYGDHAGSGAGAMAAVPEPASIWLLLMGMLGLPTFRRAFVSSTRNP